MVYDGLVELERKAVTFSGAYLYGVDIHAKEGSIGNAELADNACSGTKIVNGGITNVKLGNNACSGTKVSNVYSSVGLGSPTTYGNLIQVGQLTTGAGSGAFMTFGKSFIGSGWRGQLTGIDNIKPAYISGAKHMSGANVVGEASTKYDWMAIGV